MALINEINGSLLVRLAEENGGRASSSSSSSIGGVGLGASFDGSGVNLSVGVSVAARAFSNSYLRINDAVGALNVSEEHLRDLESITDELLGVATSAANPEATVDDRARLQNEFSSLVREFKRTRLESVEGSVDLLDKSDIETAIESAGVDLDSATSISEAFRRLGGSDGDLANEAVVLEAIFTSSGATDVLTSNDILSDLSVSTETLATQAVAGIGQFKDSISKEIELIGSIRRDLTGALNFAGAGTLAFDGFGITSGLNPEEVANQIVLSIKRGVSDTALGAHSDLDRNLAADLLLD